MASSHKPISLLFFFFFFFIFNYSSTRTASSSLSQPLRKFTKLYAFGDSYTDTGNVRTGFPNGITYFRRPSNRSSDGRIAVDFVAQSLALPLLPPYLHLTTTANSNTGVNFAVGGSTAIDHAFYVEHNVTLSFTPSSIGDQLRWFKDYLRRRGCRIPAAEGPRCAEVFDGALFWVGESGGNDYAYTFGSDVPPETVKVLAVKSVTDVVEVCIEICGNISLNASTD